MKKFIILITAGTAFAFASCGSTKGAGSCCGKCKTSCSKSECADCAKSGGTCAKCDAKKKQ